MGTEGTGRLDPHGPVPPSHGPGRWRSGLRGWATASLFYCFWQQLMGAVEPAIFEKTAQFGEIHTEEAISEAKRFQVCQKR